MPLTIYCAQCGSPSYYNGIHKPAFCSSCGVPFGTVAASRPLRKTPVVEAQEEEAVTELPNINKIEIDLDTNVEKERKGDRDIIRPKRISLGQVLGTNVGGQPLVRPVGKKVNVKKVMEELKRESSSSKESISVG